MTADDGFTAKVVAARLGVEGIVWELRGGVDGPYPFGPVHVFVPETELAEAQALLAATAPLEEEIGDGDDEEARAAAAGSVRTGVPYWSAPGSWACWPWHPPSSCGCSCSADRSRRPRHAGRAVRTR